MRILFIIAAVTFCIGKVHGQSLELGGGLNRNKYFTFSRDEGHFYTEYHPGNGFSFFLSMEDTILKDIFVKFVLMLDDYNGKLSTTSGGLAGSSTTDADVNKTSLGLGFFPFNYRFLKSGCLNFGVSYSLLLRQRMVGYHYWWYLGTSSNGNEPLENQSDNYKSDFIFSAVGRIAYKIAVSNTMYIVPQYLITFGFSKEFKNLEAETKSFRQTFAIGINRRLSN